MSNRIQRRVLNYGLLMAGIPLILFSLFVLVTTGRNLAESIHERNVASAQRGAETVEHFVGTTGEALTTMASLYHEQLLTMEKKEREGLLHDLIQLSQILDEIYVVDAEAKPLDWISRRRVDEGPPPELVWPFGAAGWQKGDRPRLGPLVIEPDGRPTVSIWVPVTRLGTREPVGGLVGKVYLRAIMEQALAKRGLTRATMFLVNEQGQLVGHDDFSLVLSQADVHEHPVFSAFLSGNEPLAGPVYYHFEPRWKQSFIGTYARVPSWGWGVIVERNLWDAFEPIVSIFWRILVAILLLASAAILSGYLVARRLTRPIEVLESGVSALASGDLEQTLPDQGSDELGRLVQAFNRMTAGLREKHHLEQRLARADKLITMGSLASGIAHEINNPLAVISGYAEDLRDRIQEGEGRQLLTDGTACQYLDTIRQQAERCKRITRNMLNLARIPVGKREAVDVTSVLMSIRDMLNYQATRKGVTIHPIEHIDRNDKVSLRAWIDPDELTQVFLNLLSNALDACPPGSSIYLAVKRENGMVQATIKDTGVGIAPEYLDKVGEAFFTTKPSGKGTGLGLSITREIINRWGGRFEISSPGLGMGCEVAVYLPEVSQGESQNTAANS